MHEVHERTKGGLIKSNLQVLAISYRALFSYTGAKGGWEFFGREGLGFVHAPASYPGAF